MDLKGKRVSTGAPNSGTEEQADYVLKPLGIDWNKDFSREKLGATESVAALKDGKIQAFFWSGAVPTASIIDLASTPGLKLVLLPVDGDVRDKIMKANPGVFHPTVFQKGSYSGVDGDVPAIAITAVLTAMDAFPAERMYEIVKTIFGDPGAFCGLEGRDENDTREGRDSSDSRRLEISAPGSEKFFKEKGLLK